LRVLTISIIFPSQKSPGTGVFVQQRAAHLPSEFDVEVWRPRPWFPFSGFKNPLQKSGFPKQEEVGGLSVRDMRFFYTPGVFKHLDSHFLARKLQKELKSLPQLPDLLDAHFAYPTGHAAVLAGAALGIPVTITLRGTLPSYLLDGRRQKMKEALLRANQVMAVSESLAILARELAGSDLSVRVIPNGIDTRLFSPGNLLDARNRLSLPKDRKILLTVGGLVPRKGAHRVIEVLPDLLADRPDALYLFVGGGGVEGDYGTELRRLMVNAGCERQVKLMGEVKHEQLVDYYRAADLFVLATSNEGWANVIQESLACGTPVVATDVGGNKEVVGSKNHGLIVPFGDRLALGHALRNGLSTPWDHEAIAAWGGRCDWNEVGVSVGAVFREAAN